MKEIYDWNQTPKTITIKLPTPYKIDPKNFNTEITEYYLQFNIIDLKKHGIIYFHEKVDFESSRIKIFDRHIEFFINKEIEANWPDLEPKLSKDELAQRRKLAKETYEKIILENRLKAEERKKDLGKFVVDKSMKLDEEKRKELREKKTQEKTSIETDLYDFVKEYDQKEKNINNFDYRKMNNDQQRNNMKTESDLNENQHKEKIYSNTYNQNKHLSLAEDQKNKEHEVQNENQREISKKADLEKDIFEEDDLKKANEEEEIKNVNYSEASVAVYNKNNKKRNDIDVTNKNNFQDPNEIFDEQTVEKNKYQIRNESKINVNLTEKAIPHFAARESLSKEPPYPKSKKFVPEKNHVKNFLFYILIFQFVCLLLFYFKSQLVNNNLILL